MPLEPLETRNLPLFCCVKPSRRPWPPVWLPHPSRFPRPVAHSLNFPGHAPSIGQEPGRLRLRGPSAKAPRHRSPAPSRLTVAAQGRKAFFKTSGPDLAAFSPSQDVPHRKNLVEKMRSADARLHGASSISNSSAPRSMALGNSAVSMWKTSPFGPRSGIVFHVFDVMFECFHRLASAPTCHRPPYGARPPPGTAHLCPTCEAGCDRGAHQ